MAVSSLRTLCFNALASQPDNIQVVINELPSSLLAEFIQRREDLLRLKLLRDEYDMLIKIDGDYDDNMSVARAMLCDRCDERVEVYELSPLEIRKRHINTELEHHTKRQRLL